MDGSGGVLVPLPFPHTEHNVIQQNRIYYIQYCIPCAALSKGVHGGGGALVPRPSPHTGYNIIQLNMTYYIQYHYIVYGTVYDIRMRYGLR